MGGVFSRFNAKYSFCGKSNLEVLIFNLEYFQERYLSEYNYDEELDEDRAKRLLNFGDDYRAFIDSLSESQQSLASMSLERRHKRSKRMRKKTLPVRLNSENTQILIKLPDSKN